ncbi:MAG: metal ABC transporter substrate-binding protein [Bacilli bacterium]|nr:metal ABC transporter substrate-binding protein [Bacilli bacterium]
MKKRIILILIMTLTLLSGCKLNIDTDSMKDIKIYTTIYPIRYLIDSLYGTNSTIYSIYPSGVEPKDFQISDKKLEEYSQADLFVFNSLDKERDYAVKMINKNKKLKIIDVSMGMTYDNDVAELWLNPYNYLMMAQNTKNGLLEYISNPYLITNDEGTGVEDKYEALKYDLSRLDADIKETISLSSYDTIVVDNDVFNFLSKYNLNVISLEEDDKLTDIKINEVKKLINEGKIKYIYSSKTETNNTCKKLIEDYGVELVTFNTMETVDGGITNSNENYVTVMNNNLELLNKELYK